MHVSDQTPFQWSFQVTYDVFCDLDLPQKLSGRDCGCGVGAGLGIGLGNGLS